MNPPYHFHFLNSKSEHVLGTILDLGVYDIYMAIWNWTFVCEILAMTRAQHREMRE